MARRVARSGDAADDPERSARRSPLRRAGVASVALLAVAAAVTAAGAGTIALTTHDRRPPATGAGAAPVQTALVTRTDLSDSSTLPGTLGFGTARPLKGAGSGIITRLPSTGTTTTRGKPLYWVNDRPVMVFYGDTPLFRTLGEPGVRGRDVTVLASNLEALGYGVGPWRPQSAAGHATATRDATRGTTRGTTPGTVLTAAMTSALRRWQHDTGQNATGALDLGHVVVLPGPARISKITAQLGDPAAGELMSLTSTTKVITVRMDATEAAGVGPGERVVVELPSAKKISGRVTSIGQDVQSGGDAATGQSGPPEVNVTVTPARAKDTGSLASAPVQVTFTTETRRDVLAVPIGALVALREGGYAVQRAGGPLVAVDTGLFAKGMVEVDGSGVSAGMRVVTAS